MIIFLPESVDDLVYLIFLCILKISLWKNKMFTFLKKKFQKFRMKALTIKKKLLENKLKYCSFWQIFSFIY